MDKNVVCTQCANKDFFDYDPKFGSKHPSRQDLALVCTRCGHIEWFVNESTMKSLKEFEQKDNDFLLELKKYEDEKASILIRIERLERIVQNESNSLKDINEAKAVLVEEYARMKDLLPPKRSVKDIFYPIRRDKK